MPQGWDFGVLWGVGVIFFFWNSTRDGVWVTYMNGKCNSTIFGSPAPWGLEEGPKVKCIRVNILDGISLGPLGHAQGFGTLGAGGQKIIFWTWKFKLERMNSGQDTLNKKKHNMLLRVI